MRCIRSSWSIPVLLVVTGLLVFLGGGLKAQEQQRQTTVQGKDMVVVLEGDYSAEKKHDLAGVECTVDFTIEGETLAVSGKITKGSYTPASGITFDATLDLSKSFPYEKGAVDLTLGSGGEATVDVKQSVLKKATFSADITAEVDVKGQAAPLALTGEIGDGSYKPGEGVTFSSHLEVAKDFVYAKSKVTASLKSGGFVTVKVEKNAFQKATFEISGELDVEFPKSDDLKLGGSLKGNLDDEDIEIDSTLKLRETFEHQVDTVTVRLISGPVEVKVTESELETATFDVSGQADVKIDGQELKLEGALSGKYGDGLVDIAGELKLREKYEYKHPKVEVRFVSGTVGLVVKKNKFKTATLEVSAEADVKIPNSDPLLLGGAMEGKYENESMDLDGDLALKEEYTFSDGSAKTTLSSGTVGLELKKSELKPLVLTELVYRVEIVVAGKDGKGKYDDGEFSLESDELRDRGLKELTVKPEDDSDQDAVD